MAREYTSDVVEEVTKILNNYGDPPRLGEPVWIAFQKMRTCIQEMERQLEYYKERAQYAEEYKE